MECIILPSLFVFLFTLFFFWDFSLAADSLSYSTLGKNKRFDLLFATFLSAVVYYDFILIGVPFHIAPYSDRHSLDMLNQASQKLSKMHARRNPNLSIQSTAPYSQLSPRVQSATTSAFLSPTVASRRGLLLRSPPASPSLPSLIPRHGKKQVRLSPSRSIKRILIGCCAAAFILWLILRHLYSTSQQLSSYEENSEDWELVGGTQLPQEPSVVGMQDANGDVKWAVSIPSTYGFPLKPAQYRELCQQSVEISKELRQAERPLSYYENDENYLDVQDAEEQKLFPSSKTTGRPKGFVEDESIADGLSTSGLKTCERSLTYVMETEEVGFGDTLMHMWMSYGLAQAENRTFFIDDSRWYVNTCHPVLRIYIMLTYCRPYGRYKAFFQPPPSPGCLPPPTSHMLPCPHAARHLVVSSATVISTFGPSFTNEWEDKGKTSIQRQQKIFNLVRTGYEALFQLRADDETYVSARAEELYSAIKEGGGLSIGMHIRRGDKHPLEYQYQEDYIPLDRYVDTARDLYIDIIENNGGSKLKRNSHSKHVAARHTSSKMVIASDDPMIYESTELGPNTVRAQDRIVLAYKSSSRRSPRSEQEEPMG